MIDRDELIRARAYAIWEAEGCPAGRDEQHWQQAALDIEQTQAEAGMEGSAPATVAASDAPVPVVKRSRPRPTTAAPQAGAAAKPAPRRKPKG